MLPAGSHGLLCCFFARLGSGKPSRTSPTYYSDWLEPDQPNKERMDCMSIGGNDGRYGWSNERCERRLAFVCENSKCIMTT